MGVAYRYPDHQLWGVDNYVPAMTMASAIGHDGVYVCDFGTPKTLDADGLLDGVAADDSGPYTYDITDFTAAITAGYLDENGVILNARFGRGLSAVGSAAGVTQDITFTGYDYLGQKIVKTIAMNGTTPIAMPVAFKRITSVAIAVGASSETIDVGFTNAFGLPYKTTRVLDEQASGVLAATLGTLTAPVLTDPATAATLDPRGVFTPNTTPDGAKQLVIRAIASGWVNASGNGGLHGIAHYSA